MFRYLFKQVFYSFFMERIFFLLYLLERKYFLSRVSKPTGGCWVVLFAMLFCRVGYATLVMLPKSLRRFFSEGKGGGSFRIHHLSVFLSWLLFLFRWSTISCVFMHKSLSPQMFRLLALDKSCLKLFRRMCTNSCLVNFCGRWKRAHAIWQWNCDALPFVFLSMSYYTLIPLLVLQNCFRNSVCMLYQFGVEFYGILEYQVKGGTSRDNTSNCSKGASFVAGGLLFTGPHLEKWAISWFGFPTPLKILNSNIWNLVEVGPCQPWKTWLCDCWINLYVFILLSYLFVHHIYKIDDNGGMTEVIE